MIVFADDKLKSEVMQMWKICFGDSDEFIDLYFRTKYRNENTLVKMVDGEAVASLQMIPYEMTFGDGRISTIYISGACTLPEKRNNGYMKELMNAAFIEMKKRDVVLTTIIPQNKELSGFYKKMGYTDMFDVRKEKIQLPVNADIFGFEIKKAKIEDAPAVSEYCNRISENRDLMVLKTQTDWEAVFEDYFLAKGNIYLTYLGNQLAGVCFTSIKDNTLQIKNLLADNSLAKRAILSFIAFDYSISEAVLVTDDDSPECEPSGMARITDVEKILSLYAEKYSNFNFSVKVTDKQADWNNNTYHIISGNYIGHSDVIKPDFQMSINLLTRLMLGYRISSLPDIYRIFPIENAVMNLMME